MANVKIDRRFFEKARTDYADWIAAFAREAIQNCADYGKSLISVSIDVVDGNTRVRFMNDGPAMSEYEITEKLLSLGATGKDFQGTIGGFGRAKELLYFTHVSYCIDTWNGAKMLRVEGSGGEFELTEFELTGGTRTYSGTTSEVVIEGDCADELSRKFGYVVALSKIKQKVELFLRGQAVELNEGLNRGKYRRDLSSGKIYTNRKYNNMLVVRIGGLVMFCRDVDYNHTVVLELSGSSSDVLTSNRDGLKCNYRSEVDAFVATLNQNRREALRTKHARYSRYASAKLTAYQYNPHTHAVVRNVLSGCGPSMATEQVSSDTQVDLQESVERAINDGYVEFENPVVAQKISHVEPPKPTRVRLGFDFVIQNDVQRQIPKRYLPEGFTNYSAKLAAIWAKLMVEVHLLLKMERTFSVGFQLLEDENGEYSEASYGELSNVGHTFFITPAVLVKKDGQKVSYRNIWNLSSEEDRMKLISIAVHEATHGDGYVSHNEIFASKYTDNMAKILPHVGRLKKVFRAPKAEVLV